jgi:hypothetical protein
VVKRVVAILIVLAAIAILTKSSAPLATPVPNGAFAFATLGDAPYYFHEDLRFRLLMRELDANDLRFTIHVGDIFWRPCSDEMYVKTRKRFDHLRAPVIYTPGDNEWVDCWEPRVGGYVPLERLALIRRVFFSDRPRMPLARQAKFPENSRWTQDGIVFATVHLTGSFNAMKPFEGRTAADDTAARERTAADTEWMREAFRAPTARAFVIALHGGFPFRKENPAYYAAFEPFVSAFHEEVRKSGRPVLLIHGDDHEYTVDHPWSDVPNLTRLEVPGSPDVGWVRVLVTRDEKAPFAFDEHLVPRWKYW